jgi:hypothetical protein
MNSILVLNLRRRIKMMKKPLPNDKMPKPKIGRDAIVNTKFPRKM